MGTATVGLAFVIAGLAVPGAVSLAVTGSALLASSFFALSYATTSRRAPEPARPRPLDAPRPVDAVAVPTAPVWTGGYAY